MTANVLQVSQKTAFLIFLAMVIVCAPVLYAYIAFSGRFFTASPDWWATWLVPTSVAAVVLALASILVFRKSGDIKQPGFVVFEWRKVDGKLTPVALK